MSIRFTVEEKRRASPEILEQNCRRIRRRPQELSESQRILKSLEQKRSEMQQLLRELPLEKREELKNRIQEARGLVLRKLLDKLISWLKTENRRVFREEFNQYKNYEDLKKLFNRIVKRLPQEERSRWLKLYSSHRYSSKVDSTVRDFMRTLPKNPSPLRYCIFERDSSRTPSPISMPIPENSREYSAVVSVSSLKLRREEEPVNLLTDIYYDNLEEGTGILQKNKAELPISPLARC
ncbi:MAG: hypothetical protein JW769_03770 [Parachlamydiales bacterium]|nr:hypothetical protein [Parachlamydiales bacterium]